MKLNETERAYLAGIVDGEGSIVLQNPGPAAGRGYFPLVAISTTSPELADWLLEHVGGWLVKQKRYSERHSQAWNWRIKGGPALALMAEILPYMVIEEKIARAQYLVDNYARVTVRNGRYSDEQRAEKEEFEETWRRDFMKQAATLGGQELNKEETR